MESKKFIGMFLPKSSFYLLIIFFLLIIISILEFTVAIPGYALFLLLLYYNFRTNYKRHKEITRYIEI